MKLLGISLLSVVPLLFFYHRGEEEKRGLRLRKGMLLLLGSIEFQIRHFNRAQNEIFSSFREEALEKVGFLPALRQAAEEAPCGALGSVMERFLPRFSYSSETGRLLLTLAEHFGLQAKEDQLGELSRVIGHLENEQKTEQSEVENKVKILRMVGLSAGLGIWILLI